MKRNIKKFILPALVCIVILVAAIVFFNRGGKHIETREHAGKSEEAELVPVGEMKDGELLDYEENKMLSLAKYRGIKVTVTPTQTEVYQSILLEAEDAKVKAENADRVENGDWISLDYEGFIDGQPSDALNESGAVIKVGAGDLFTPAFERGLMGLKIGGTYSIDVSFAEDYFDVDVAGQDVTFSVTVNSKFNDAYANEMSKGKYKTVAAYYQHARAKEEEENRQGVGDSAWDELVKECKVKKYPEGSKEQAYKDQKRSYQNFAQESGMTYEEFIQNMGNSDEDVRSLGADNVRDRMIAKTIASKENLTMTDQKYEQLLLEFLAPEEENEKNLKAMEQRYKKEQSCYPRDDMLIEYVKEYIGKYAKTK